MVRLACRELAERLTTNGVDATVRPEPGDGSQSEGALISHHCEACPYRLCEKQSDEAISQYPGDTTTFNSVALVTAEIASLRSQ